MGWYELMKTTIETVINIPYKIQLEVPDSVPEDLQEEFAQKYAQCHLLKHGVASALLEARHFKTEAIRYLQQLGMDKKEITRNWKKTKVG